MSLLDLELDENGAGAKTLRGYLVALLTELWREGDEFSGKRPFGDSGWQWDIYIAMAEAGLIDAERIVYREGEDDEWSEYESFDYETADKMILDAIQEIVRGAR